MSLQEQFGDMRADYSAAKHSQYRRQRTGVAAMGSGADYHYARESDYLRLIENARDMDRNDTVCGQAVDRATTNIIQGGIQPDPSTGNAELDNYLKRRWKSWAEDADQCEVSGEMSFHEIETLVCRNESVDGDVFVLLTDEGSLQIVEAHRCRTPRTKRNVVHGVELSSRRKPLTYWFTADDISPLRAVSRVGDMKIIKARNENNERRVLHIYNRKRPTQTRGVTAFAPIFEPLAMFEDINYAKMIQQQVVSCFAILRYQEFPSDSGPGGTETGTNFDGSPKSIAGLNPALEFVAAPGEKIEGFSPNVPNAEFFNHVRLMLTLIGINLGLPLILVTMDGSETNFSGWRGAMDQAKMGFRKRQKSLIEKFHRPVYEWKVRQWIEEAPDLVGLLDSTEVDVFSHTWKKPSWPYIEPLKDASAFALKDGTAQNSLQRLVADNGDDWDELYPEIINNRRDAIRYALQQVAEIKSEFANADIHWRDLMPLQLPSSVSASIDIVKEGEPSATPQLT
jgi:lambda family phage portal protein